MFGITDKSGFDNANVNNQYNRFFGGNINMFFKPFTTNPNVNLEAPKYKTLIVPSGRANASGLNPFGSGTYNESIVSGPSMPNNLDVYIAPGDVRTFGLKNPLNVVGWGYDIFGYPAPNFVTGWNISGAYGSAAPGNVFRNSGIHGNSLAASSWLAGPKDLRWDQHRGVWTSPQSVYAASITYVYVYNGSTLLGSGTSVTGSYFYTDIKYNAIINDGVANYISLTGISPISQRPESGVFKGKPLPSGSFCFIGHYPTVNGPRFGVSLPGWEIPDVEDCGETSSGDVSPADLPLDSEEAGEYQDVLTGEELLNAFGNGGMASRYGGTGFDSFPPETFLIGRNDNTLGRYKLIAGSGISVTYDSLANSTGYWTVSVASGIATVNAGVLNGVTEIQGLTTPLSIDQGGTGSSTKNFVDLTTSQTVSGVKSFSNPIRASYGTTVLPSYSFANSTNYGIFLQTGILSTGIAITTNSFVSQQFNTTGIMFRERVEIKPYLGTDGSLTVWAPEVLGQIDPSGNLILVNRNIFQAKNNSGNIVAKIGLSGEFTATKLALTGNINSGVIFTSYAPSVFDYNHLSFYQGNTQVYGVTSGGYTVSRNTTFTTPAPSSLDIIYPSSTGATRAVMARSYTTDVTGLVDNLYADDATNIIRINPTGSITNRIRGITSGYAGQYINLRNISSTGILISHEEENNTSNANRLLLPYNTAMVLRPNDTWKIYYDDVSQRWIVDDGYWDYLDDPIYCAYIYDDFFSIAQASSATANGGSIISSNSQSSSGQFSVIKTNITNLSALAGIRCIGSLTLEDGSYIMEGYVRIETVSNGTNNGDIFFGLATPNTTGVTPADSIGFVYKYNTVTGYWMARTSVGNLVVSGTTNARINTLWTHLKAVYTKQWNGSGKVDYYINNQLQLTHTGFVPHSNNIFLQMHFLNQKQLGTSNLGVFMDYWQLRKIGTRARYGSI